jgi:hypothetical protein
MEGLPRKNNLAQAVERMIERDFTPKHEPRTQGEIQRNWDEHKAKQSKKFDPKNLEQKELFD